MSELNKVVDKDGDDPEKGILSKYSTSDQPAKNPPSVQNKATPFSCEVLMISNFPLWMRNVACGTCVVCVDLCQSDLGGHLILAVGLTTCIWLLIRKHLHCMNTRKIKSQQQQLRMDQ